jgi:hypothetical protein
LRRIGDFIRNIWAVPDELLVADVWRFAILVSAAATCFALVLLGRAGSRGWRFALVAASALTGVSVLLRPASLEAVALTTGVLVIAAAAVMRAQGPPSVTHISGPAALVLLAGAAATFHVVWFSSASQRAVVLEEMRRRPADPWPRGTGHAMLSWFGAPIAQRGWLEAGGGFSPELRTFGISIWVTDRAGKLIASSDSIALADTRHVFRSGSGGAPGIEASTPFYTATWTVQENRRYLLELAAAANSEAGLELVIRSVGPAGGPVREITIDDGVLKLDSGWAIFLPDGASPICLGDESAVSIQSPCPQRIRAASSGGWTFARIRIGAEPARFEIAGPKTEPRPESAFPKSVISLKGFPTSFTNRMEAQANTLLTGIVDGETRPGDPVNYPLSWQRDGAYMLVALARAGYAPQARAVSEKFASEDFFGGFGSEADAPGLSIWALGEVASALRDPEFDEEIWEHVLRKAGLIEAMLRADAELRVPYTGPIVPRRRGSSDLDLVALPAADELIRGRMDWQWPIFYVNAVSYLGLVEAAAIADRLHRRQDAVKWRAIAELLRGAYRRRMTELSLQDPEITNPRTAISGLWPADIAEPGRFGAIMKRRWSLTRSADGVFLERPLWTYFSFAEAHQWLRLGKIDPVLQTLNWFDTKDEVPGLQVYWEGEGEENSFGGWRNVRGNLEPQGVTPHFWTSAEALLLSIEMLAYVDKDRSRLMIGGGLPAEWLQRPVEVRNAGTSLGAVSWLWNGRNCLTVDAPAASSIILGAGFPNDTRVVRSPELCPSQPRR